jgi:putative membrane protein
VALALLALYAATVTRPRFRASGKEKVAFVAGVAVLTVALTWPLADLSAHWSLLALVLQRLILMLAVPPLLIVGLPRTLVRVLTRPAAVDATLRFLSRPVTAVVVVTVVSIGTLTTGAVHAQATSSVARALFDLLLLAAGVVLWTPVLDYLPGAHRMSPLGRAAYLIVQSIVPSFLSVVWIFAHHPLYSSYAHRRFAGLSPLLDQQLAGFAAKLGTIAVLWTVAFVLLNRAHSLGVDEDAATLEWADVERELERVDRRRPGPGDPGAHPTS